MVHALWPILATMVQPLTEYAERLQQAMRRAGREPSDTGSVRWLAEELGVSYQAAKKAVLGSTKMLAADNSAKAAQVLGVNSHWLATGDGDYRPMEQQLTGVATSFSGVAHDLIHLTPEDAPTNLTWENILSGSDLPPRFSVAAPDDALAPVTPRGTGYLFAAGSAPPADGTVVIVQAGNGRRYMRLFFAGNGNEWEARARDPAHRALHSGNDELTLLASATHRAGGQG